MKSSSRALYLLIAVGSLGVGCGRSEKAAGPAPPAAASPAVAASAEEISVDYQSVSAPTRMAPASEVSVRMQVKNVGTKSWPSGGEFPLHFGYHWEAPAAEGKWDVVVWDDSSRTALTADVLPGQSVEIVLPVHAPAKACAGCRLVIAPLLEMKAWSQTATHSAPIDVS